MPIDITSNMYGAFLFAHPVDWLVPNVTKPRNKTWTVVTADREKIHRCGIIFHHYVLRALYAIKIRKMVKGGKQEKRLRPHLLVAGQQPGRTDFCPVK